MRSVSVVSKEVKCMEFLKVVFTLDCDWKTSSLVVLQLFIQDAGRRTSTKRPTDWQTDRQTVELTDLGVVCRKHTISWIIATQRGFRRWGELLGSGSVTERPEKHLSTVSHNWMVPQKPIHSLSHSHSTIYIHTYTHTSLYIYTSTDFM